MEIIALLPGVLCALACLVAFCVDLLLIPADRSWVARLEIVEVPLVIAVSGAVAPGLFGSRDAVTALFCLAGALLLGRYVSVMLHVWRGDQRH